MRKIFTLLSFVFVFSAAVAQDDLALAPPSGSITSPVSGCALTANENVTVSIFNFGPGTVTSPFNVSYSINGGPAVTEMVAAPNIPANTSFTYTFTTQADLSVPGTYTIDATVSLAGDPTAGNNTYLGYTVTNTAPSVGGTISGPSSVCITGNSGTLTLSGHTGNVLRWEYSTDGGGTWVNISNTTTTQNYNNLTVPTMYRAVVQNGSCAPATSAVLSIAIDPATVGGTTSPASTTVCSGSNSGTITLSGRVGSVLNWEFSTDGGATWTPIANTTASQTYTNLTTTTLYRAVVQSGSCAPANSSTSTINVSPNTVGGSISPASTTVCSGSNSGTLTLSGHTGSVLRWEFSTDGGITWTNIANTTTTQTYTNLTSTRLYRALVRSGVCPSAYSATATITVVPGTTAGTVASSATVCSGSNSGTLTLTGNVGSVIRWEFSTNGGITWTNIANTTTTQTYTNLTTTTMYRVLVQNGTCASAYSNAVTITVNPVSVGGTTASSATVCSGSNSGTITLSGQTGTIQNWIFSTDGGITWTSLGNTTTSQTYTNLTTTTLYSVIVQSGVCPADTSTSATITVDPVTVGGSITGSTTVCSGNNSGTLNLTGNTGSVLSWEFSTDNGLTWISISNTTTSQTYTNLTTPTMYRALVQSGVCSPAYSGTATIGIDPVSNGGTLYGTTTVCSGSNSGTITLIGQSGTILGWESSIDNGVTWTPIANTTTTENYTNLTDTTIYRTIVQSGVCPADTSSLATVYVDANSIGGIVSTSDTVCSGSNSGTLTLSGHLGNVIGWEISTDAGVTWISISNTTVTQAYLNLTATTMYRALVKNGVCNPVNSAAATITVDPASNGGMITGAATVCASGNNGLLTLTGYTGTIAGWESSTDGVTWTPISNTTDTLSYTNLTDTTMYHVIVMSGVCPADTSAMATIIVDPATVGGMIAGSDTVCAGMNGDTLVLIGYTGSILGWEFSNDGGNTWLLSTNTSDSLIYSNLSSSIWYRVRVKSGVCGMAYSDTASVIVDPVSVGGTVNGSTAACEGASGTLTLTGHTGSVQAWESSTDGGVTWTSIANTTTTLNYSGLTDTTWYRVIVMSGGCAPDTSSTAMIIIYPKPVAAFTAASVCEGSATVFTNTTTIASGNIMFSMWDFGDGNVSINPSPIHTYADTGTYSVTLIVTSNFNCTDTVTMNVTVNPLPSAVITSSLPLQFCMGDSTMLSAPMGANYAYLWSTGDTTQTITVDSSGTYTVMVTDTLTSCASMDSVTIVVNPLPVANAGMDTTINLGSSVVLNGSGGVNFIWTPSTGLDDPNIASPVAAPIATTDYILTVTDVNGCTDMDTVTVTVEPNFDFMIANMITPNGDGYNDTWYVENIGLYPNNQVSVFNRNGQQVFTASAYDNTWNGDNLPDGTYYYVIEFTDTGKVIKGAITIIRNKQ